MREMKWKVQRVSWVFVEIEKGLFLLFDDNVFVFDINGGRFIMDIVFIFSREGGDNDLVYLLEIGV